MSNEKNTKMSYPEFVTAYMDAFNTCMKYSPNEVGSGIYAEKMAVLSDEYPGFEERLEADPNY